jgi:hypothetical protein
VASGVVGGVVLTSLFTPSHPIKFLPQWEALQIIKLGDCLFAKRQPVEAGVLLSLFSVSDHFIYWLHSIS